MFDIDEKDNLLGNLAPKMSDSTSINTTYDRDYKWQNHLGE